MNFHVLTIFPELVRAVFESGVLRRAVEAGLVGHNIRDLRDWTSDVHRTTDDLPYGGGPGMVMRGEPIFAAVEDLRAEFGPLPAVLMSPAGQPFDQRMAEDLARSPGLILICGRYEGVDQRVVEHLVDREISIGDYVLSGGELAAMVVIDAIARQIPGVVGNSASLPQESFQHRLLDWPHYTRPENLRGYRVPEVLLSGHHAKILSFREDMALLLTYRRRPDLLSEEQRRRAEHLLANQRQEGHCDAAVDESI